MMPPPQPHHVISYGNPGPINTPIPNSNTAQSYYRHPPPQPPPTAKRPTNLRVEIPNESPNETTTTTTVQPTFAPPSALPSQFAQNLPSPSTFYPEFYQQNELPSPLNFSSTPISGGTSFHWPSARGSISGPGVGEYRPSPLAKL